MGRERGEGGQQISRWGAWGARARARCPPTRAAGGTASTGGVSAPENRYSRCRGHQELPTKVTRGGKDKTHPHSLRPIWLQIGGSPDPVLRSNYLLGCLSALRETLPHVYRFLKGYRWTARWRGLQGTVRGRVQCTAACWVPPSHPLCTHRAPAGGQTLRIAWRVHHTRVMDL